MSKSGEVAGGLFGFAFFFFLKHTTGLLWKCGFNQSEAVDHVDSR